MEIAIFNEVTTESFIAALEEEGASYDGLYVDMDDTKQRKYCKDKAATIADIRKKLNRARIDLAKKAKSDIEKEFSIIDARLAKANEPFDLLINEHKARRAEILAEEKRIVEYKAMLEQKELDHEMALLINKTFEFDKAEAQRIEQERQAEIKKQADERAEARQKEIAAAKERDRINEENARLANVEHVKTINNAALNDFIEMGLTENNARAVVTAIAKNLISNVTINY